jgi:putative ABC transport system permease protein
MSNLDVLFMAVRNLLKRKMRTFLTILGVVIGTVSIVIMLSLGFAMSQGFDKNIEENMGEITTIEVSKPYSVLGNGVNKDFLDSKGYITLNDKTVEAINKIDGVKVVIPNFEGYLAMTSGRYKTHSQIIGIFPEHMQYLGYQVENGRTLTIEDENTFNIVGASQINSNFYNPKSRNRNNNKNLVDVLKDNVELIVYENFSSNTNVKNNKYKVKFIGMFEEGDWRTNYYNYMDMNTVKNLMLEKSKFEKANGNRNYDPSFRSQGYSTIFVQCINLDVVLDVQNAIKELGYTQVYSRIEYILSTQQLKDVIQMVLGAIGGVSFIIAAINIANTMVMAIYERRREIGVMKVIGASISDIKKLFLVESALIGICGGIAGVILSTLISIIINYFGSNFLAQVFMPAFAEQNARISYIPYSLALSAMAFASIIGLVSGYLPARRATKLSALVAIKSM